MNNTITTDYTHTRPVRRQARLNVCPVCATCHNTVCPVWRDLALYSGIDCGALFRVLDDQGFVCERHLVPAMEVRG